VVIISAQIANMQNATRQAVTAIKQIDGVIGNIGDVSTASSETQAMTRSIEQAARVMSQQSSGLKAEVESFPVDARNAQARARPGSRLVVQLVCASENFRKFMR